jgi:hypothetical protein
MAAGGRRGVVVMAMPMAMMPMRIMAMSIICV